MDERHCHTSGTGAEKGPCVFEKASADGYRGLALVTARGEVEARYYEVGASLGAIFVGGVGGGWDTPAQGLYPRIARDLAKDGVTALRIRFRNSRDQEEAAHDVRAGIDFLRHEGVRRIALVGHSLGGAAVVRAAAGSPAIQLVVTLGGQVSGVNVVDLTPDCALVLIHGRKDTVIPEAFSRELYDRAHAPKELIILPDEGHVLDRNPDDIYKRVRSAIQRWLIDGTLR